MWTLLVALLLQAPDALPPDVPVIDASEAAIRCVAEPRGAKAARLAVVGPTTPLHRHPDAASPAVIAFPVEAERTAPAARAHRVFEVVEERGEWVALRSNPHRRSPTCYGSPNALLFYEVTLWARATDLTPVVRKKTRVPHADGTSLLLRSATALRPVADRPGRYLVLDSYGEVEVELSPKRVARTARADPGFDDQVWSDARVDLSAGAQLLGQRVTLSGWNGRMEASVRGRSDGRGLATLATGCARYKVLVDAGSWRQEMSLGTGLDAMFRRGGEGEPKHVRPGAPLWWPDGTRAGLATCEDRVFATRPDEHGRRCASLDYPFGYPDWQRPEGTSALTICFAPADLGAERFPAP